MKPAKAREKLQTTFNCLFCQNKRTIEVRLKRSDSLGTLKCRMCTAQFQMQINYLHEAVDVYSAWVDRVRGPWRRKKGKRGKGGKGKQRKGKGGKSKGTRETRSVASKETTSSNVKTSTGQEDKGSSREEPERQKRKSQDRGQKKHGKVPTHKKVKGQSKSGAEAEAKEQHRPIGITAFTKCVKAAFKQPLKEQERSEIEVL
eukprot:gnl/MRDRNA2_/MRDRNA2_134425_c0_seq1.p1 gnl/MRDRNA2_/MRDRNA2_134425_c0~~gnl/MRDRNA2_/MRDRNA2_134425_c0_seq1.p1  ORF type:complete len:235 (+),score=23.74 gnl/MRDRNA2_/MRDRNA2_134425_c0_seq1:102-707(+)